MKRFHTSDRVILWVTWEEHRRTSGICRELGIDVYVISYAGAGWKRYIVLAVRTVRLAISVKPDVLIVQNPSLLLTALAAVLKWPLKHRLVVDAHNEAITPYIHTGRLVRWLSRLLLRAADITIVTNSHLAEEVAESGGVPFVMPDKIPALPHFEKRPLSDRLNVVFISTFAKDEPTEAVFEAVSRYMDRITLYVTGHEGKLKRRYAAPLPQNVKPVGYLCEHDYWELLNSADAVIDLTLMDNCLVCGGYEALAASKPLILSDNAASKQYFGRAAVYVDNSVRGIADGFEQILRVYPALRDEVQEQRSRLNLAWQDRAAELMSVLSRL